MKTVYPRVRLGVCRRTSMEEERWEIRANIEVVQNVVVEIARPLQTLLKNKMGENSNLNFLHPVFRHTPISFIRSYPGRPAATSPATTKLTIASKEQVGIKPKSGSRNRLVIRAPAIPPNKSAP